MNSALYIFIPLFFLAAKGDILFPLKGNVYPDLVYNAVVRIGGTKSFLCHVDTGSDVSWVQCQDKNPCSGCTMNPDALYRPHNNYLPRTDKLCKIIRGGNDKDKGDWCTFTIEYGEESKVEGVAVTDKMASEKNDMGDLVFGCADKLTHSSSGPALPQGLLGLGNSAANIVDQLDAKKVTSKVFGHCLGKEGGHLFIGESHVPTSGVTWAAMSTRILHKPMYTSTQGELFYDQKSTGYKDLSIGFDSGRTFTSFLTEPYQVILNSVKENIANGKILEDAGSQTVFEICWKRKDNKPIRSIEEIRNSFKPLKLVFKQPKYQNPVFEIPLEAYLVLIETGHVCFGIWPDNQLNIIGAISMQNLLFIYDKRSNKLGWKFEDCKGSGHMSLDMPSDDNELYGVL